MERRAEARRPQAQGRAASTRKPEPALPRSGEPLHIWSVGFGGNAAKQLQRSCEHVGTQRCFADGWRLVQYVMPCFGGALVRRPDLLVVNAERLGRLDLDWLQDIGGRLPIWQVSSRDVLAQGEASLALRLRAAARTLAEGAGAAWP